jgi:type VI secretion system protein ImpK
MEERARAAGVTPEDIRDAEYPLIAFFDELLLHLPWSGQTDWRKTPLQLLHYNENAAGETFFRRVHVLLGQPHRAHVLTIYFFAMALGFQGRYAVGGPGQIDALYDTVGAACGQAVPAGDPIGPHASRPDAGRNFLERQAPIVRASVACFGVALVLFAILRVVLSAQASRAERTMDDYTRGSGMGAP